MTVESPDHVEMNETYDTIFVTLLHFFTGLGLISDSFSPFANCRYLQLTS